MGWSIAFDRTWNRDIGYGVPAYCDHPDCGEEIDRGLSYVCGSEPRGGDVGCGLYFCDEHHLFYRKGCSICQRCYRYRRPYTPTPDHPRWIRHKLRDWSWRKWRLENHEQVRGMCQYMRGLVQKTREAVCH